MKVAVANDHRGVKAITEVKAIISQLSHECVDFGCVEDRPIDYPDVAYLAAKAVSEKTADRAILVCGTGIGMSIVANKIKGVRAALCYDELNAQISRQHNDANVLALGARLIDEDTAKQCLKVFLETDFEGGRHARRVGKFDSIGGC